MRQRVFQAPPKSRILSALSWSSTRTFFSQFEFVFALRETFLLCLQENKMVGKTEVVLEKFQVQASNKRIYGLRDVAQTFVGMAQANVSFEPSAWWD